MKSLFILLSLGVLVSCSTAQERRSLAERIQIEEVRSLHEIMSHAEFLVESHPELDGKTKKELEALLSLTMKKHQAFKEEESKIFQLLLTKSLKVSQLTDNEVNDKNNLKQRLKVVYEEKLKNILFLINKTVTLSGQRVINEGFSNDMIHFMREFR